MPPKVSNPPASPEIFETRDVIAHVGISPIYLNKYVERKMFGISPRLRPGSGRGSRRWFDRGDILAIALIWWLFQSGLRAQVIGRVLSGLSSDRKKTAYGAALALLQDYQTTGKEQVLVIERELAVKSRARPAQNVMIFRRSDLPKSAQPAISTAVVVPTGELISGLNRRLPALAKE